MMANRKVDSTKDYLTFNETIDELALFLEVAIHYILYVRQIYPHDLFERRKKYNTPVFAARHPLLIEYISTLTKAVKDELSAGSLSRLSLIFFVPSDPETPLESFNFDFSWLVQDLDNFVADTDQARTRREQKPTKDGVLRCNIELFFRAFILKISTMEANLTDLPADVTFTAVMELADGVEAPFSFTRTEKQKSKAAYRGDGQPWIPAEKNPNKPPRLGTQDTNVERFPDLAMQPVKTLDLGLVQLNLTVTESRYKIKGLLNQ